MALLRGVLASLKDKTSMAVQTTRRLGSICAPREVVTSGSVSCKSNGPLSQTCLSYSSSIWRAPVSQTRLVTAGGSAARVGGGHGRQLSTMVSKKTPTTLGEILDEEIKAEKKLYHKDEFLDAVPAGFKVVDSDGDSSMELISEYQGEQIAVTFSITDFKNEESDYGDFDFDDDEDDEDVEDEQEENQVEGKEETEAKEEEGDDEDFEDEDEEYDEEPEPSIDFNVHIGKGKETLTFECTTDGTLYSINTVNMSNEESQMDVLEYEGPNFEDLEEPLQEAFFEYLHERGITYEFARYLFEYAIDKEQREYMKWLKDIKGFVSRKA